ncbi:NAD(P)/FAD-dependent oxidoreductase [Candidatus Cyanaurora vandensis]|uniref:NAD(P)/FAD-dependent oxidoreductase n=1 Tax=Candidatus Cyanaurora vandensis TaxID=2714958 RepID=UPI00257C4672|nr:NAD(P)/FAD-dependent oxidoreductase [Candidatus Cyanaurora vandensis]
MERIVIAGGGFGGLYTALQLQKFPWRPRVTLIDPQERFVFTPLLYELVSRELAVWEIAPTYRQVLDQTGIEFIQGEVSDLDLTGKVLLKDGTEVEYSQLVIALGGRTPTEIVPGAQAFALPFRTLAQAEQLVDRLAQWDQEGRQDIRIAVVGGGASGVELTCKLADRLQDRVRLTLIEREDQILGDAPALRDLAMTALVRRGVTILLKTTVESVEASQILLKSPTPRPLTTDLVLWAVGTSPAQRLQDWPLTKDRRGRLSTRPTLQLAEQDTIFALGDCATDGQGWPISAQVAFQQADYCAWNLWAQARGLPLLDFRYSELGQMVSLGMDEAAAQLLGVTVTGAVAANLRRAVYLARLPNPNHQVQVGLNWLAQPLRTLLATNS